MHFIATAVAEAESGSKQGLLDVLGIDWKLLLIQAAAFLILVWLLGKFVWPVLMRSIDSRREQIEAGIAEAQASREALEKAEQEANDLLAKARKQADEVIDRGQKEAAEMVSAAEAKAQRQAERLIADARKQLDSDIAKARRDLKSDTAKLVAKATEQIIGEKLTSSKDTKLIEDKLREVN